MYTPPHCMHIDIHCLLVCLIDYVASQPQAVAPIKLDFGGYFDRCIGAARTSESWDDPLRICRIPIGWPKGGASQLVGIRTAINTQMKAQKKFSEGTSTMPKAGIHTPQSG